MTFFLFSPVGSKVVKNRCLVDFHASIFCGVYKVFLKFQMLEQFICTITPFIYVAILILICVLCIYYRHLKYLPTCLSTNIHTHTQTLSVDQVGLKPTVMCLPLPPERMPPLPTICGFQCKFSIVNRHMGVM